MLATFTAVFSTVLLQIASAQEAPAALLGPTAVQAQRASIPIVVDGDLGDPAWRTVAPAGGFRQREPDEGAEATERTEVRVLFDDAALYVGARLHDRTPDSIIARLARRDNGVTSDRLFVFFDPYHDRRTGFYFGVNAAGTLYDGTLLNDDWDDDTWDGIWDAKVVRDSAGWSVEMRIPFSQLRFRQSDRYLWGINFKREIARRNEHSYLVMVPRKESGFVSRFLDLEGIREVRPPRRLEVLPYVTSRAEFLEHAPGDPFNDGSRLVGSAGVDLKLGIGSNMTLDATVNPDFGQVEVDPAVVNLSDVETFFQEKRPFFVEGLSIFDFGSGGSNNNWGFNFPRPDLFYTRRIGRTPGGGTPTHDYADIPTGTTVLGAAKLSGKVGRGLNVGLLSSLTGREEARLDSAGVRSRTPVEPRASYHVFRMQQEFGEGRHAVGLIATGTFRDLDGSSLRDQFNRNAITGGVDGWTTLDSARKWVLTGQAAGTRVSGSSSQILSLQQGSQHYFQRPDARHVSLDPGATSISGWFSRVALNKQHGNWQFNTAIGAISPGFDANDLGFQSRTDAINGHVVGGYSWTKPGPVFRRFSTNLAVFRTYDFGGNKTWEGGFTNGYGQLRNFYTFNYFAGFNPEVLTNRRTRGGPLTILPGGVDFGLGFNSDDRKAVVFGLFASGNHYRQGSEHSWSLSPSIEWKPASTVSVSFEPGIEWGRTGAQYVQTESDTLATATFQNRYIFADLRQTTISGSMRLNWTFSPKLSLELYAQPLLASGDYRGYKELARPRSFAFTRYGTAGTTITPVRDTTTGDLLAYTVNPGGGATPFDIGNGDFSSSSLRGNAVLRWEYLPGSTLFLVWTQERSTDTLDGGFRFGRSLSRLFSGRGNHIFAVKLSYWWHP